MTDGALNHTEPTGKTILRHLLNPNTRFSAVLVFSLTKSIILLNAELIRE